VGVSYDGKAIHTTEAVSHVAPSSHSQPFDTAFRAYSSQAVDLQEVTSEPACAGHADRPGIRVGKYCLVVSHALWSQGDLSACPHRQVDSAPRSCCGLHEKTPVNFPEKGDGLKSQKGLPDPRHDGECA